ncbi:hypothetical protein GCM10007385_27360 [Tateyamaria omphalii]|nr:hypothetical protein GCM10007385_27360 [Tateyamaria omphalii]
MDQAAVQKTYLQVLRDFGCQVDNSDVSERVAHGRLMVDEVFDLAKIPKRHRDNQDLRNIALEPVDDAVFALERAGHLKFNGATSVISVTEC